VLAVCGDGGFMMNSQELETAARLKLNLVVLILQDNAYGMIRWKQAVDGFGDFGMSFGNPDFVAYAASFGLRGSFVESADGLAPALEAAFTKAGSIWSRCRWIIRRMSGSWSTNCGRKHTVPPSGLSRDESRYPGLM
jgi:thiamine pyrophosphate-dependent acetolactate synthase large subunit-like protein